MLLLLSPAKSLDYETPPPSVEASEPLFTARAAELVALMRQRSSAEVAALMNLSDALADLNVARYAAWRPKPRPEQVKPALFAFDGDVYGGLDAASLRPADVAWAQQHVAILSGLYGLLRPLDRLQAYRLEMGTRLPNPRGKDLYAYWGATIAEALNAHQEGEARPVVVNLASEEYFKAVDRRALRARVVHCVFEDWKGGAYKIISFHAKRARGMMARHAIRVRARSPKALERFTMDGYAFDAAVSEPDRLVFRRRTV